MSTNSTTLCGSDMDTGGIAEFVEFAVGATRFEGVDHPLHLDLHVGESVDRFAALFREDS